jgi:hypothetical protein
MVKKLSELGNTNMSKNSGYIRFSDMIKIINDADQPKNNTNYNADNN